MAKVDKYFLGAKGSDFDYLDKARNIANSVGYMLNRTNVMFKYTNLPDSIPARELELLLQTNGFAIFTEIKGDYYVVNGGLGGVGDVYNNPTQAMISIPYLNHSDTLEIGKDCIVIGNDSLKLGLLPIFQRYSMLMNENMISMTLATVNKRMQTLISASDDNTVKSAEAYLKNLHDGKIGVIAENRLFDSLRVNPANQKDVVLHDLIEFEQYIKASMYNEVGLSANYNMKKERITSEEFTTNSDNLFPLVDDMLNSRQSALEEINLLYGLDITVEFYSSWNYRDDENLVINPREQDNDDETGNVDGDSGSGDSVVGDNSDCDSEIEGNDIGDVEATVGTTIESTQDASSDDLDDEPILSDVEDEDDVTEALK